MHNDLHATTGEVAEGHAYPTPFCGAAAFDPDNLLDLDRFSAEMEGNDPSDLCWECRSILA